MRRTYQRIEGKDVFTSPKTRKSKRKIPIPDFLCQELSDYIQSRYMLDADERLFPVTKSYLAHEMIRGCKNTGIKKIRIHDIRHSHTSLIINQGYDALMLADRLGHEKVSTTLNTYSHLFPHKQQELVKAITELRQELNLILAFILDTINSNEDLPHIVKSVYYYTLSKIVKDDKNDEIMVKIINIFYPHKERYGCRRIHLELLNKGYKVSHGKVKRLMSRMGLYAFNPTPKQRYNSYKGDMNGVCKNLLLERKKNKYTGKINEKRNFEAAFVNQKWTTDVSEFKIAAGKLYLSPIMDIYNHKIVGFDISDTPNLFQIYRMLVMAFKKFDNLEGLIFHSDQGWQYQHFS